MQPVAQKIVLEVYSYSHCSPEMSGQATDDEDEGRQSRRKQKQYAHVSSGCGFGRPKKLLLESFWKVLWPQLVNLGWTKVCRD